MTVSRLSLDIPMPGYEDFITPWLVTGGDATLLVDPGPACGFPSLKKQLRGLPITRLDYILVTHVHLDHAGGVGDVLTEFPGAKVLVHPRGRVHLSDPSRVWESSLQTLGDVTAGYGKPRSVPETSMLPAGETIRGVRVIDTPGHASHHQCYLLDDGTLFTGEAAGVFYGEYMRPATPPRFVYDVYAASLAKLADLPASLICCGHWGCGEDTGMLLRAAAGQMELWRGGVADVLREAEAGGPQDGDIEVLADACLERVLRTDARLAAYRGLPPDIQSRERFFLKSSLKGFIGDRKA